MEAPRRAEAQPPAWAKVEAVTEGAQASSSNAVAVGRVGDRELAFLADEDDRAVHTFDVHAARFVARTPIGAAPTSVVVLPGGRLAVLGRDDARVHLLEVRDVDGPLVEVGAHQVADEPASAAATKDGRALVVVSRWGHALTAITLDGSRPDVVVDLPRDPSAVLLDPDGRRAFVAHAVGSRISVVDLARGAAKEVSLHLRVSKEVSVMPGGLGPRPRTMAVSETEMNQTFALARDDHGRVTAPGVRVNPGATTRTSGYGVDHTVVAALAELEAATGAPHPGARSELPSSTCLLPRAAAFDAASSTIFVACVGTDRVEPLKSERYIVLNPGGGVRVAGGPTGIAVIGDERRAVVWSAFARAVTLLALDPLRVEVAVAALPKPAAATAEARGRALFHRVIDRRVAEDGRACASCHPDGRDDGLSWSSPGGRRQTPMLVDRLAGTAPYGWSGEGADFAAHLKQTVKRLSGTGIPSGAVRDLEAYLATLRAPATRARAQARRGAEVFASAETGCATCHAGSASTDRERHDVGSTTSGDPTRDLDTPSLRHVGASAPYFHDGRYATLDALLRATDGQMGHSGHLSAADRGALLAYLQAM